MEIVDRMLIIYEGPRVGEDPDIAAEIVRELIKESARLGDSQRAYVASLTIARNALAIRLKLNETQLRNEKQYLGEMKAIFGGIAQHVYTQRRMGIKA